MSLYAQSACAVVLEELAAKGILAATLAGKKVGYYVGSFDPLHLGHEEVVQISLQQEGCDYVLIYPAWGSDSYKNRTDVDVRLNMLKATFADHSQVLVTQLPPQELQALLTQPVPGKPEDKPRVKPAFDGTSFIGIMGSDNALALATNEKERTAFMSGIQIPKRYENHTLGSIIALPVDSFIVVVRATDDITPLQNKLGDRPFVTAKAPSEEPRMLSSTAVRQALKEGKDVSLMVNEHVLKVIKDHKLYF
jgi:cytidyltransferase-related domain